MKPECQDGYTRRQIEALMGPRLAEFDDWMYGQTMTICDGRAYNHGLREYESTGCGPHGAIAYSHDVARFFAGGRVVD